MLQSLLLFPASIVGLIYHEYQHALIYFYIAVACLVLGYLINIIKPKSKTFYATEGFVTVALSWILMSLIGAIPLYVSGDIPKYTDALFEVVSGFTTTGSSILTDVEALSHANLFWRSSTHWIGGMGVLVFIIAIMPKNDGSTMNLMKAESPGPSVGKLVPKINETAFMLYKIYIVMTIVELILLIIFGMPVFDAICLSFGTAGTGGFGIKNDSIAGYSIALQNIITIFMFLFGVNFTFYYYLINRKLKNAFSLEEVHWYFIFYFSAVILITTNLVINGASFGSTLQKVFFQVASVMTTTGYATYDFNLWPEFSKGMMLTMMLIGACAGSTGGGIKVSRIMIYLKQIKKEMMQQVHARQIRVTKMDSKGIEHSTLRSCNVFIMMYITIYIASFLIISLNGFDFETNFTAVLATLNNIGPGLSMVGPTGNFAEFNTLSKFVLMFDMLAGRLEIIPMLILFHPRTWKIIR